jgi:hypothetical protein
LLLLQRIPVLLLSKLLLLHSLLWLALNSEQSGRP